MYDLIVVGSGAAGMMSAIIASKEGKKILLLEKLSKIATKLKATGGGRCNLTNNLPIDEFMSHFGKNGRFMTKALRDFDQNRLRDFFSEIGVQTHCPDGFRVFPVTHDSLSIVEALQKQMQDKGVEVLTDQKVQKLDILDSQIIGISTSDTTYQSKNIIIATGGLGYPSLGGGSDIHDMLKNIGHHVTSLYPAMMPLLIKEDWVKNCRADTLASVKIKIDLKKAKKLTACGDLIFTKTGIRGPVVLDFAREIIPFLDEVEEVPLLLNFTKGMNEEEIREHLKAYPDLSVLETLRKLLPSSVALELCKLADVDPSFTHKKINGKKRDKLIKLLAWVPLTVIGHDGFEKAMITRGGVTLKEINPNTMKSKLIDGLYFCGEVVDLDGACGGFNLQWSFSSGYLAGQLLSSET